MRSEALARAGAMNLEGDLKMDLIADLRFVGQAFEVPATFDPDELPTLTAKDVAERFQEAHHKVYFFGGETAKPVEFVSFRLGMTYALPSLPELHETEASASDNREIDLYDDGRWQRGQLVSRASLPVGGSITGPALLEDPTSTVFLPTGWTATRDAADNTVMTWSAQDA